MKVVAVIVATGLVLVAAGCSGGDDEEAVPGRAQPKLSDETAVTGGEARERAVLRRVASRMEKTTLPRIVIAPLKGRRETDDGGAVAISFAPAPGRTVRRQWEEWIVAGAFSRSLDAAGLPAKVDAAGHAGRFTARPRLRGQPDPRPLSRPQQVALVRALRNAVKRSGADLVRLEAHRPYGTAIAFVLSAQDPARYMKEKLRPLLERLDRQRTRLEGLYLAILDPDRRLALEWGSWTRNPAGSYWVRRDLANCSPIRQTEPPGVDEPPACPV